MNWYEIFQLVCATISLVLLLLSAYQLFLERTVVFDELKVHFHRVVALAALVSCIMHPTLFCESYLGRQPILHNISQTLWDVRSLAGLYSLYFLVAVTLNKTRQVVDIKLRVRSSDGDWAQTLFRALLIVLVHG